MLYSLSPCYAASIISKPQQPEKNEIKDNLAKLKTIAEDLKSIDSMNELIGWDLVTYLPKSASDDRAWHITTLTSKQHEILTSKELGQVLGALNKPEILIRLNDFDKVLVQELWKSHIREKRIPLSHVEEFANVTTNAFYKWVEAKEKKDFQIFEPSLEKIIDLSRQEAWHVRLDHPNSLYNTLLDSYESGLTTQDLDQIFLRLKVELIPFIKKITSLNKQIDNSFLFRNYTHADQLKLTNMALEHMDFDFTRGRVDETVHPFVTSLSHDDIRFTTRLPEKNISFVVGTALHEGGHAHYEFNMSKELERTPLYDGSSLGIHEAQARLYETRIGLNMPFWKGFFPKMKAAFPEELKDVDLEKWYLAINKVNLSPVRLDSDELTYNLHIIIRYEIEKDLMEERISVKDVPRIWKEKTKKYLGVESADDSEGSLQDSHWAGGSIGYFPTYTLGNLYAAQFYNQALKEVPNLEKEMERGNMKPINKWLGEKIHKCAATQSPQEIVFRVTGEKLNPDYFIKYIKEKYMKIYRIED